MKNKITRNWKRKALDSDFDTNRPGRSVIKPNTRKHRKLTFSEKVKRGVSLLIFLCALSCSASEAVLNVQRLSSGEVVLFITGGTSNVQYQIYTSPDNTINNTNWYYWRREYSRTFYNTGDVLVYSPSYPPGTAASKPMRFFQIRGVLPD